MIDFTVLPHGAVWQWAGNLLFALWFWILAIAGSYRYTGWPTFKRRLMRW
jgi:hypothetical protein